MSRTSQVAPTGESAFNPRRLSIARKRRGLTAKALAEKAGLVPDTISRLENGARSPDDRTISKLSEVLGFPKSFFGKENPEEVDISCASFRRVSKLRARLLDATLSASTLGVELNAWIERQVPIPAPDLLDLSHKQNPDLAATFLRDYWTLAERQIEDTIGLLESKGVRVFSLSENAVPVDSFSFWRDDKPYIFLDKFETRENSRFKAVHELGHLVMHRHIYPKGIPSAERQADRFASAFLMPERAVRAAVSNPISINTIIMEQLRWGVSASALAQRLHSLQLLSPWQYKSVCIQLDKRERGASEPDGIPREMSTVWQKIIEQLQKEKTSKSDIAKELHIPLDELEGLIWNVPEETHTQDERRSQAGNFS